MFIRRCCVFGYVAVVYSPSCHTHLQQYGFHSVTAQLLKAVVLGCRHNLLVVVGTIILQAFRSFYCLLE